MYGACTVRRRWPCLLRMVGVLVRSMYVCMYVWYALAAFGIRGICVYIWYREEEEEEEAGGVSCKMQDGCGVS